MILAALMGRPPVPAQEPSRSSIAAPEPSPAGIQTGTPVFRSDTDLVVLYVNVFDERSNAVPDLPQTAFAVFEDDRPQTISLFSGADVPVTAGLVIDNSGSMIARRDMVLAGTAAFAKSSHPEDELFTVIFNERVRFGLPPGVAFTQSRLQVERSLVQFSAGGKTAVYDAVIEALDHLNTAQYQKRVLILLSDGEDNASRHSKQDMLTRASSSDAIVYTVSKNDFASGAGGDPNTLRRLASATGGTPYFARTQDDVVRAFETIAVNIRRGYSLGYVPSASAHDGAYHRLRVVVDVPGRKNLTVRVRDGYTAPAPDAPH